MTDLSAQIETNSNKVIIHDSAAEELINRVRSIPNLQTRHLICFGNKVFDTLAKKLEINKTQFNKIPEYELKVFSKQINNENWHFYRVWHYSNYGGLIHKSEVVLPVQLKYINDNIGRVGFNQSTKRVEFD